MLNKIYTDSAAVSQVHGGMEDWGYAASWDTAFVCVILS